MEGITKLHYTPAGFLGDVHPYYENGTLYLFYLKTDGNFSSALAVSRDFRNYEEKELFYGGGKPLNPYYVLNVVKEGEWYRSFFGAGSIMASSKSKDLIHWETGMETEGHNVFYQSHNTYPCEGRDPFVFYDEDTGRYRIVSTAYYSNAEWGRGEGMDSAVALSDSLDGTLKRFAEKQKELIRFPDGYTGEPEVSQMMKIGDRWYLFICMARRTAHFVGPVSYYIGDKGKGIDEVDWTAKEAQLLTGEDLCAAQLVEADGHFYLFGWIPQRARENTWGGSLNLLTEVYEAEQGGILAVRLEPKLRKQLFGGVENWAESNGAEKIGGRAAFKVCGKIMGEGEHAREWGAVFRNADGFTVNVLYTPEERKWSICAGDGYVYSSFSVPEGIIKEGEAEADIVVEDDILELFYGGVAALCARVDRAFCNYTAAPAGEAGGKVFRREI